MPYTPTTWVFNTTQGTFTRMNNLETQYAEATLSFEQDLFTAFVFSGLAASGTVGTTTVNVTAGIAFLKQTDGTLRRRAPALSTQTTVTPSATYHLYLQPDGTWYWSTSNSPAANSLFVAQVTTDGSGNIATVVDERTLTTTLLSGMAGTVSLSGGGALTATALTGTAGTLPISSQQSGAANGISFKSWDGAASHVPFSVGGQFNAALAWVDNTGSVNAFSFAGNNAAANTFIYPHAHANSILVLTAWTGSFFQNCLLTNADGSIQIGGNYIKSGQGYLGFKDSSGNKIAEMKLNSLIVGGSSATAFSTSGASSGFGNSATFDTFDVAEAYATDSEYERGAVLCPGPGDKLTRCTHDKCRAALIVSTGGAVNIGGRMSDAEDYDSRILPMALVGRVLVDTDEAISAFAADGMPTLVTANGRGGVRAMRPRERGFALGYALTDAHDGRVGVVVRPLYCQAPAA